MCAHGTSTQSADRSMHTAHSWSAECDGVERSGPTTWARLGPEAAGVAATTGDSATGHMQWLSNDFVNVTPWPGVKPRPSARQMDVLTLHYPHLFVVKMGHDNLVCFQ